MVPEGKARAEVARESAAGGGGRAARRRDTVKTAATRAEEKVTFYRTLTAPTQDLPQVGKPTIEERLVPKDEPARLLRAAPACRRSRRSAAPEVAPERRRPEGPPRPTPAPVPRARRARRPRRRSRPAPAQLAAAPAAAEPEAWTVQVSAFRSRALAEELRARLAARGFDAYVFPSITEDGRPRYRVRVGAYPARSDAERAAAELRSERGLNPLVTPRTR